MGYETSHSDAGSIPAVSMHPIPMHPRGRDTVSYGPPTGRSSLIAPKCRQPQGKGGYRSDGRGIETYG